MAGRLISVIDDDESVRRTTLRFLESFGFCAVAFDSAESFLNSPSLPETSCIILDVQMPGMNGLELQSQLAVTDYRIPIIFITAFGNRDIRRRAMQGGAVAFLEKPVGQDKVLRAIELALHNERAHGETRGT